MVKKKIYERGSSITFRIPKYKPCSQEVISFLNSLETNTLNSELINALEAYVKLKNNECIEPDVEVLKAAEEINSTHIEDKSQDTADEVFSENKTVSARSYTSSINRALNSIRK